MAGSTNARLLSLIGDVLGLVELDELREALLVALDRAVPSDWVSINEVGPSPADMYSAIRPEVPAALHSTWAQLGHENPLIARFARTRDTRPYRFSDVISRTRLHSLALYRQFYAELGVEHQIAFVIAVSPPLYVGIALSRRTRDFTNTERTMLDHARPYLIQIYRTALSRSALQAQLLASDPAVLQIERLIERGLTAREAQILGRVARGQSNAHIAAELHVSDRTIGKHLQRCYRKLSAANRSHAATIAWELAEPR